MNWKIYALLFGMFLPTLSAAQDYALVDRHAQKAPRNISKKLPVLSTYLANNYSTDLEKVRSFYSWIVHNISYDKSAYKDNRRRINRSNADVLDRRQAVCFGYTMLFKEMCDRVNIPCEVVFGYVKNQRTGIADLSSANHAWNAVQIDGKWHLVDLTWGSGNKQEQLEQFFLTPPEEMIFTHLPADPMWQLLDCPIKPGIFRKAKGYIQADLKSSVKCFEFRDSIAAFLSLSIPEKRIKSAKDNYLFNPIQENKEELGHTYMDYVSTLSERAEALELTDSTEAIKAIHLQIIEVAKEAEKYIELYDHQKENLAYSHINYAIALSKEISDLEDRQGTLEEMLQHFEKAKTMLAQLPKNVLLENALQQIEGYIEWVRTY